MRAAIIIIIVIALVIGYELYTYSKRNGLVQQIHDETVKLGLKQADIIAIMNATVSMPVKDLQLTLSVLQGFNSGNIEDATFVANLTYIADTYNIFN